jgi:hypothetical protein
MAMRWQQVAADALEALLRTAHYTMMP